MTLFIINNKLYSANAGDSRIILAKQDELGWSVKPLTRDHKPNETGEAKRIKNCGGVVEPFKGTFQITYNYFEYI